MKRELQSVALGLALLAGLSACVVAVREPVHEVEGYYGDEVILSEPAPAPRTEVVVGVASAPHDVWVGGYWSRTRNNWYWVGGHWDHQPRGYVWRGGHWR